MLSQIVLSCYFEADDVKKYTQVDVFPYLKTWHLCVLLHYVFKTTTGIIAQWKLIKLNN